MAKDQKKRTRSDTQTVFSYDRDLNPFLTTVYDSDDDEDGVIVTKRPRLLAGHQRNKANILAIHSQIMDGEALLNRAQLDRARKLFIFDSVMGDCKRTKHRDLTACTVLVSIGQQLAFSMPLSNVSAINSMRMFMTGNTDIDSIFVQKVKRIVQLSIGDFFSSGMDCLDLSGILPVQITDHVRTKDKIPIVRDWSETTYTMRLVRGQRVYRAWVGDYGAKKMVSNGTLVGEALEDVVVFDNFGANPEIYRGEMVLTAPLTRLLAEGAFTNTFRSTAVTGEIYNTMPTVVLEASDKQSMTDMKESPSVNHYATGDKVAEKGKAYKDIDDVDRERVKRSLENQVNVPPLTRTSKSLIPCMSSSEKDEDADEDIVLVNPVYPVPKDLRMAKNAMAPARPRSDLDKIIRLYENRVCTGMAVPRVLFDTSDYSVKVDTTNAREVYRKNIHSVISFLSNAYTAAVNAILEEEKSRMFAMRTIKRTVDEKNPEPEIDWDKERARDAVSVVLEFPDYDQETMTEAYAMEMIDYETYKERYMSRGNMQWMKSENTKDPLDKEDKKTLLFNKKKVNQGGSAAGAKKPGEKSKTSEKKESAKKEKPKEGKKSEEKKTKSE